MEKEVITKEIKELTLKAINAILSIFYIFGLFTILAFHVIVPFFPILFLFDFCFLVGYPLFLKYVLKTEVVWMHERWLPLHKIHYVAIVNYGISCSVMLSAWYNYSNWLFGRKWFPKLICELCFTKIFKMLNNVRKPHKV